MYGTTVCPSVLPFCSGKIKPDHQKVNLPGKTRCGQGTCAGSSASSDLTSVILKPLGLFTFDCKDDIHEPFPSSAPRVSRAELCSIRRHNGETCIAMPIAFPCVPIGCDWVCVMGATRASGDLLLEYDHHDYVEHRFSLDGHLDRRRWYHGHCARLRRYGCFKRVVRQRQ